jgi:acetyl esterase
MITKSVPDAANSCLRSRPAGPTRFRTPQENAAAQRKSGVPSQHRRDPLRDEAILYALRLLRAGVVVELHQVAGGHHGFDQQVADAAISRRALSDRIHHLKRFLRS